jgi:hypothetical protein
LGMFKDSAIILMRFDCYFWPNQQQQQVRVNFGQPPLSSSSTSSLPSRNQEYHLKTFDKFTTSFP